MIRSILAGALVLAGIQVLVSTPGAYGSVGTAGLGLAKAVGAFLSPHVPAIPDRRKLPPTHGGHPQ